MNEEQKMFKMGVWALTGCVLVMVALQVANRIQRRTLNYTNAEIVKTQQQIAVSQAKFESMINAAYLQSSVMAVVPRVETIGLLGYRIRV